MHRSSLYSRDARLRARLRTLRPTRAIVELDAIAANFGYLRERAGGADVLCIVKADAYGHGAVPVARRLEEEGARWFGVAILEEGLELREAGIGGNVLLLGGADRDQLRLAVENGLTPAVVSHETFEDLVHAARWHDRPLACHLKVDTGMTRLGIPCWDFAAFAHRLGSDPGLRLPDGRLAVRIEGLFTHLASSDDPSVPFTGVQLQRFRECRQMLEQAGLPRPLLHVASSAGLLTRAESEVDLVRPGVALYGLNPFGNVEAPELTPALTLMSRIVRLAEVPPGTSVGYGCSFITVRRSTLATVPLGYDDGLPRELGDRWEIAVRGQLAPIVGRVSMDLIVVDVTSIPKVANGDDVVVVGGHLVAHRIEEMARRVRTIPYEITCGISSRVPRVLLERGEVVGVRSRFESLAAFADAGAMTYPARAFAEDEAAPAAEPLATPAPSALGPLAETALATPAPTTLGPHAETALETPPPTALGARAHAELASPASTALGPHAETALATPPPTALGPHAETALRAPSHDEPAPPPPAQTESAKQ